MRTRNDQLMTTPEKGVRHRYLLLNGNLFDFAFTLSLLSPQYA